MPAFMPDTSWRARADETFLVAMPGRGRIALEITLLLVLVFGENLLMVSPVAAALVLGAGLALAMALVSPWARVHGGIAARVASTVLVVLAVLAPAAVEHPGFAGLSRRLGVGIAVGASVPGDPPTPGGVVLVQTVEPHSPADGVLRAGDRIVALGGAQLERADPVSDLTRRTHGDELPEDTTVSVLRDGAVKELPVHIPRVRDWHRGFGRSVVALRDLSARHIVVAAAVRGALLIALLLLLLRADGQPLAAIGIVRKGALRELVASTWMTLGAFGVQIAVAIPVGIIGVLTGVMNREASQRTEALGVIAGQGSVGEFVVGIAVAAAFEEVAFRGFLTPRMRAVTGSWPLSIAIVSVAFGLGHTYEGVLAVVQTAFLGAYFSLVLLARRRLLGPTVAHAGFNTAMFLLVRLVIEGGVVDRLKELAPH
jgi:uncharacterized protein